MKRQTIQSVAALIALAALLSSGPALAGDVPGSPPETEMGKLAASLKPGEMKRLETRGYTWDLMKSWYDWETGLRGAHKSYSIISWSNDANWDPVTRQLFYFGLGHYASPKFVKFSADSNEWQLLDLPTWADKRKNEAKAWPVGHTYDCEGICPEKRLFVVKWRELTYVYHIDSGEWTARPSGAGKWTKAASTPLEYFPEMNGFLLVGDGRELVLVDVETWKPRGLGQVPLGIHGAMEYNPVHKVMLVGGGDAGDGFQKGLSLVDGEGTIRRLGPAPVHIRCTPEAKLTCDPISGEFLVQGRGAPHMYAFHPIKDEWKELELKAPDGLAAQIPTYGVVMFCASKGKDVWLYRHEPVWPGDVPKTP
jgi:hypothetical protein